MGLLDGSGDLVKATQPIQNMTSCLNNAEAIIPTRVTRLTMPQLYQSLKFHSGAELQESEFRELSRSTTNFAENSYSLHGDKTFTELARVQAKKTATAMTLSKAFSCDISSIASNPGCVSQFIDGFASRVLRKDLKGTPEGTSLQTFLTDAIKTAGAEGAARQTLEVLFQHPLFLYRQEIGNGAGGQLDSFELATMIAYSLTDLPPDDALWQAATSKTLNFSTMEAQLQRLLAIPEISSSLRNRFFKGYLLLSSAPQLEKEYLPLAEAQSQEAKFQQWIANTPMDQIFTARSDDSDDRLGIHTHRYYLMNRAKEAANVSAIFSGIALRRNLLCQVVAPPRIAQCGYGRCS